MWRHCNDMPIRCFDIVRPWYNSILWNHRIPYRHQKILAWVSQGYRRGTNGDVRDCDISDDVRSLLVAFSEFSYVVASLMSLAASLVTTSRKQQCFDVMCISCIYKVFSVPVSLLYSSGNKTYYYCCWPPEENSIVIKSKKHAFDTKISFFLSSFHSEAHVCIHHVINDTTGCGSCTLYTCG